MYPDSGPSLITTIPGPKSVALHERRTEVVPYAIPWSLPVYIDRGEGPYLFDVDGNRFVDMGSGIGVTSIGHGNLAVIEAATTQLRNVTHTLFGILPYEGYVRVAEFLSEKTPGDHKKSSVLVNSGSEAIETAVKVARKYTQRRGVVVLDHAFHGRTNLTLTMNHKIIPYGLGFGPYAPDVFHAPNSYPLWDGLSGREAAARTIQFVEETVGAENVAALIFEPIQGEGGFIVPADGYLPALQAWARNSGIVMVADEIQSGMGRTGCWFASEHFDIVPDLVVAAKALAGGLPLASVTGRAEMMDSVQRGGLGGTFGGNPVACAAAIAVFEEIETRELLRESRRIGRTLEDGLCELRKRHPVIGEVRGIGAMQAIELTDPETGTPIVGSAKEISAAAASQGIILLTAGSEENVIRFLPNFTTPDSVIDLALSILDRALSDLENDTRH
ncbi:aspartate aminotransferase family protein (plasmid) [Rhodococcus qingshengii]|uniref:aminotransferase class III-fold pyridoxal phosphate-dependent enzyme n=1 Tax=Rhodococcus qingshengii TaxID=334542 RepID=UPI0007E57904|nr:aminotransferase class III-fold pyridoxal phosphate-dependent enzyme [Rhodococcus qingshengii]BCF86676.1 aspartate aminotransferase family protein [Rhodococcus qingshengii]